MNNSKAVREAKARLAAIEAHRADLAAQIDAAEAARAPFQAKFAAIRARRLRVPIVSDTGGSIWFGSLGSFGGESYARRSFKDAKPKAIADALTAGNLKVSGNGGVALTLRGLAGRVRTPNKALVVALKRATLATRRAEDKARLARQAEAAALRACYDQAVKVPTERILPDLVAEVVAMNRLDAVPIPHEIKHELERLVSWEGSDLALATQHLKHAKSGSTEPCPCANCAMDRQKVIRDRDEAVRRAALPTRLATCTTHGKRRMAWEPKHLFARVGEKVGDMLGPDITGTYGQWVDLPVAYCPGKGKEPSHGLILVSDYLAERAKAKIAAEKAAAKLAKAGPRKARIAKSAPGEVVEGDTITFTCPSCGDEQTSEVYEVESDDEDLDGNPMPGELRVGCGRCEAEPLASAVVVITKEAKAA